MLNSPDEPARGLAAACLRRADVVVFGDGALGRYGWALEGVDGLRAKVLGVVGDFDSIVDGDGRGVMRIGIPSQDANDMFKCLAVLKEAANACAGAAAAGSVADLSARRLAAAALRCLGLEGDAKDGTEPAAAGAPPAAAGSDVAAPCISSECAKALTLGPGSFDVVVLGGLGGRFDHEAQSLNALVVWEGEFASMWLLSTFSAVTLLPAGASRVRLSPPFEGPTCGVIPIGEPPSRVVTTGLRWNLGPELKLAYGACVSSSNHAEDDVVAVETDRPVLFTAALDCDSLAAELDSFKPKKARDVALHPGDDPSTMAMPSGARPEDKEIGKLTPRPYKGTDHDDLDPHVKESTSPRRYSREQAIAETRRTERIQNLPKGFRTWEEVSRADARRLHQVQKEQERNREQAILSKPLKVALPKPGRGARRSGSVLGSRPGERGAEERQGADGEDVMEAPRAVSDTKHRKSLRLSRVAAQLRRELANVLSQRRIREPGLYPLGLPLHVVEVEVSPDLRVARVRWQLPVVHAPRTRAATLRGGQTASQRASTAAVLGTAEPSAVEQLAAREWSRRVADTLSRGADKEGAHPGRLAREAQRREKDRAARRARMQAAGRMARQAGLDVEDGDSDLDLLDDEGGAGTALPEALRRRMEAASPDAAFGVDSAGPGGALAAFLGAGARAQGAPVPLEKTASGAEEGSLAWRLDQSVLRSQLAQWRSSVRAGTRKPTVARVMGWAERAAVPSDPVLRAAFKEAKSALDRRAPELRRQVGARVPLRILPRLEFHPWLGSAPNELLNAARQGMTSAARAPLAAAAADGERA